MDAADFRRIALSLEGGEEHTYPAASDFRVGGRIFAALAFEGQGYGDLMLTPKLQAAYLAQRPDVFLPVTSCWGKSGVTHIRLAAANENILTNALRAAWKLRVKGKTKTKKPSA